MILLWFLFGLSTGVLVATLRFHAIESENSQLREALSRVRTMALLGSGPLRIKRAVDSALGEEAA